VLEELATLGRIKLRRHFQYDDSALRLHTVGQALNLDGSTDLGPMMSWRVADFAVVLLKRSLRAAGLSRTSGAKDRLLAVADNALEHMLRRRLGDNSPAKGLWDDPAALLPGADKGQVGPSWYMTKRMIECLTSAANSFGESPIRSARLTEEAVDLLGEADHLLSQTKLASSAETGSLMYKGLKRLEARLDRARRLLRDRPGTAVALTLDVLRDLDEIAVARQDATGRA
jgi:hypothetical protein